MSWKVEDLFPTDNAIFSGGFGLAILASGAQVLRSSSKVAVGLLKRHMLVTLEVTSKDKSYNWVLQWLYSQANKTQHLSVATSFQSTGPADTGKDGQSSGGNNIKIDFVPGPGQHFLNYKGTFMMVQRMREQQMMDLNTGKPWEKVTFTSIGRSTRVFEEILNDAYELASKQEEGKTIIFTNWGAEWRAFGQARSRRPLSSVILDQGVGDRLLNDVLEWSLCKPWYTDRGIPYRRGYLLHGPPGSGKSSFIFALAGRLGYNICMLNLAERGMSDDRLAQGLSRVPPQSIVLLEDIDAAFPSRESEEARDHLQGGRHMSDVTFSGLLNVLDGVASSEDRIIFMTTNYIDRLDPALIRPGRVDYVQLLDNATDFQIRELLCRFYPDAITDDQVEEFVGAIRAAGQPISMALLQGFLLRHKDCPDSAVEEVSSLWESQSHKHRQHSSDASIGSDSGGEGKGEGKSAKSRSKGSSGSAGGSRRLTVDQVDRMYFAPQEGWDKDVKEI